MKTKYFNSDVQHSGTSSSSVASFMVLGGGGGGKTPKCTDKNIMYLYFHDSKYICIVIYNAVSFNYLWYGAINDIILTKY